MSDTILKTEGATKYDSNTLRNTHQFITFEALNVLKSDFSELVKSDEKMLKTLEKFEAQAEELKKGCIAPDYGIVGIDRDYSLYQDHFYDPDSNQNFTATAGWYLASKINDTAESQCRAYVSRAIRTWRKGDEARAVYYFGKALHYFEDSNEPHHVLNWTGGAGTAHTRFEYYAEDIKTKYGLGKMRNIKDYEQFANCKYIDFIHNMEVSYAHQAKALEPYVSLKNSWSDWDFAIEVALKHAIEGVAVMIYRFLKEIAHNVTTKIDNPIGNFHVVIKTGEENKAGTDDAVYFFIKDNQGNIAEFNCDLAGNDFELGCTGIYQFQLGEASKLQLENIVAMGLRKDRTGLIDNQMLVESLEVYFQGECILDKTPKKWLSYYTPYEVFVKIRN